MKRLTLVATGLMTIFLLLFLLAQQSSIGLLEDPAFIKTGGFFAATGGLSLLAADVLIPVPSSLVMMYFGIVFGVVPGFLLSLTGSILSSAVGYAFGKMGAPLYTRIISSNEQKEACDILNRWGAVAILATRPIPILSETLAVIAGAGGMKKLPFILVAFLGGLPGSFLFAWAGATARSVPATSLCFGIVIITAAIFWFVGQVLTRKKQIGGERKPESL